MVLNPSYQGPPPYAIAMFPLRGDHHELHYEVRGKGKAAKLLVIMGAFGTCRQLAPLADRLCEECQVLLYDHRGVGRSKHRRRIRSIHTSTLLAQDALQLIEHVWGLHQPVHVLGISMGGMVAQMLGCMLAERERLASLTLAVSAASMWRHPMRFPFCLCRHILAAHLINPDPQQQVRKMVDKVLPAEILEAPWEEDEANPSRSTRQVLIEGYVQHYEDLFTFHDLDVCAAQIGVLASHRLKDKDALLLRTSGASITVVLADNDRLVKPAAQRHLARILNAQVVTTHGGHVMAYPEDRAALVDALFAQIRRSPVR